MVQSSDCVGNIYRFYLGLSVYTILDENKRFQVDGSRGQSRWYSIYFRPLSWTIDYLSSETFQWRCFPCGAVCMDWTVGDYRWEDLFTMFCYFAPVTRHSFQAMYTVFSRKEVVLSCLTVCSEFPPEKPTLNRDVWLRHDGAIWAVKHLELVHVHHLANPYTGFKITAKAVGKNSGSCFSVKNKFAHAMQWSMSAKFGIFVCF